MFIYLKQLHNNSVFCWDSKKQELGFREKGNLVISADEISTVEPEKVVIMGGCIEEMPEEIRNKFNDETQPIISKITLKNNRQFLVKESPQEIVCMLSEEN